MDMMIEKHEREQQILEAAILLGLAKRCEVHEIVYSTGVFVEEVIDELKQVCQDYLGDTSCEICSKNALE